MGKRAITMSHIPPVGIIMGSQSDWPTMKLAADILDELGIAYETKIVSAHRTPDRLWAYGKSAAERGLQVIVAGAGGAAPAVITFTLWLIPAFMLSSAEFNRLSTIGAPQK